MALNLTSMQRAIHSRFFRDVYRSRQQRNNLCCIYISIGYSSAVVTSKPFAIPVSNMETARTSLTCVGRRHINQRNTSKSGFVSQELSELIERPLPNTRTEFLPFSVSGKPDVFQVLDGNSFSFGQCPFNNSLADCVIDNSAMCSFFPGKPFQNTPCVLCAFGLKRTPNLLSFLSILSKFFRTIFCTIGSGGYRKQTKIHPDKFFYVLNILIGNINGLQKKELSFLEYQISLTLNVREIVPVVANKGYLLPSFDSPDRNNIIGFVCEKPTIISYASKWSEDPLCFAVQPISISDLRYAPDNHLGRKVERIFQNIISSFMELELMENLFIPCNVRKSIATGVGFQDSFLKLFCLFLGWQKFYFQCQLHIANIQIIFTNKKKEAIPPPPKGRGLLAKLR
jgi:hypothetical protein